MVVYILPLMVLLPFLGLVPLLALDKRHSWNISIAFSVLVALVLLISLYVAKTQGLSPLTFNFNYIPSLGVGFSLQYTSLNLILVVMTVIVFLAASFVGKYFIGKGERIYNMIFLLSEGSALGVFLSANLFLFYIFFEISEVMLFFIIFIYGGYDRRYAAIKFIVYSLVATLCLLIGIIVLYASTTPHTFNISAISLASASLPVSTQLLVLALFVLAFMIKAPVFPFHTWLPDAHTEAPATGSMILAGVLLKFGGYGFLITFLMLPIASHYAIYLAAIFGFSAIYGALTALKQSHLKRMIAYTSVADMGIVAFGLASFTLLGNAGGIYLMLSHGIAISMLFMLAGSIDDGFGTLLIDKIKGLVRSVPDVSYLFLAGIFITIGLPLTTGFIGDLLVFFGAYSTFGLVGLIPMAAIVIVAAYFFWVMERAFFNATRSLDPYNPISRSVIYTGAFLSIAAIALGIAPAILLGISGL